MGEERFFMAGEICKRSNKNFDLDEIKKAFWKTFHKSGELWFSYFPPEQDCEDDTLDAWEDFLSYLTDPSKQRNYEDHG
jgi:hypothetical protein